MRYFILTSAFLFIALLSYAQDSIVQKNGSAILAKVLEIDKTNEQGEALAYMQNATGSTMSAFDQTPNQASDKKFFSPFTAVAMQFSEGSALNLDTKRPS